MMQNNCTVIGLTGGIASGKSTVSNILMEKGYEIIDADKIARKVVEVGKPAYIKIVEEFEDRILLDDKTIDRKALGHIIFKDEKLREKLNNITHPYIFESIKLNLGRICMEENIVFLDIPLLFEQLDLWKRYDILFDEILLIYVDEDTQVERLIKRDNISREEALNRMKSQLPMGEKKTRSSKTIDNSGDIKYLNEQIEKLLLELI